MNQFIVNSIWQRPYKLLFLKKNLFCVEVQPINNVMIISGEQQKDSAIYICVSIIQGFPGGSGVPGSVPGLGIVPGNYPPPTVLPGEPRGQRSLVGYVPWGHKESDTAERLSSVICDSFRWTANDSATHIRVSILPQPPSHPDCHITLSRVTCAVQYALLNIAVRTCPSQTP